MNITDIRIRKVQNESKMKAIVSVTFDDQIVVHNMKVIDGQSGLFIAMPSRKTTEGEYKDIVHPINSGAREKLQNAILEEYHKLSEEEEKVAESI